MSALQPPLQPILIETGIVRALDQTRLPEEERWLALDSVEAVWEAIRMLRVRGAPLIGIAAACGLALAADASTARTRDALLADLARARGYLASARPTAVNLAWALSRVMATVEAAGDDVAALRARAWAEARAIQAEDLAAGLAIGEHGARLLREGAVLTHCNTGALATAGWGTALAPVYVAHTRGLRLHVWADETRPLLQGARLTAWELARAGIPVTVIADSMAATVLARGEVQAVLVGADRVAANGDVANKVGTYPLAIVARELGVPCYVALPWSTVDLATPSGTAIPIEERDPRELTHLGERRVVPEGATVFNPAFDITPHAYVTAFITDRGLVYPPFAEGLARLAREG